VWNNLKPIGKVGVVVLAIIVAFGVYTAYKHLTQPAPSGPVVSEVDCELAAGALGLIATGLRDHEDAEAILGSLSAAGAVACKPLVETWVSSPSQITSVPVNGQTQSLSGNQVAQVPQKISSQDVNHTFACIKTYSNNYFEEQACFRYERQP
jgi:hypothetical protein